MITDNFMIYANSYSLIQKDYLEILEYIEPTDSNLKTFSHRIYELFLRTATEFENICKEKLFDDGYKKDLKEMNISDFKILYETLSLGKYEIGLKYWNPEKKYIKPFSSWDDSDGSLAWYKSYNNVKHNRILSFKEANLENLTMGFAGLFLIFYRLYGHKFFNPYSSHVTGSGRGLPDGFIHIINNSVFDIKEHK